MISEVLEKSNYEKEKVLGEENQWTDKQDISERLLGLMNDRDDQNLLMQSKFIMSGIRALNEKLEFKEIRVYNDLDTSLKIDRKGPNNSDVVLSQEELVFYLSQYLTISDPNILEYKA